MGRVNRVPLSFLRSCWLIPSSRIREPKEENITARAANGREGQPRKKFSGLRRVDQRISYYAEAGKLWKIPKAEVLKGNMSSSLCASAFFLYRGSVPISHSFCNTLRLPHPLQERKALWTLAIQVQISTARQSRGLGLSQ